jgi:hypothetical protein
MAEEDKIQYTTFTGENRNDDNFRNRGNVRTSREVDNVAKFTDWKSKKYTQVKGSEIIKQYNIENFKSSLNKSINLDIDPDKVYWFHREKEKVGGLTSLNQEKEIVKELENAKLGGAVDNIAKNIGIKMDLVDDYAKQYNINPRVLGGVLARGGAAWLDPVSEALEVAFGKIGLKGVATKWFKGEMYGLAASAIAGLAVAGAGIAGKKMADTTGRAVMDLYVPGYGDAIPELEEDYYVDSLIDGIEVAAKGSELLPSSMIAKASAPIVDPMKDKIKNVFGAFK